MRKIFNVMLITLLIGMLSVIGFFAYAETFRQGDIRFSFNPSNIVTKTAAYTVTASDSQVNVTNSTANIVITLPTVASTRPGMKAYKILKTDATAYAVIVTPASGDTIGGESTRYLTTQNDYIVISPGNGNDWQVAFESPYIKEDYEAGTVTFNKRDNLKSISTTTTLSTMACGTVIAITHASSNVPITLPAATSGCDIKFISASSTSKYNASILTASTANIIYGATLSASSTNYVEGADTITMATSTRSIGDWVKVDSDGTNWYASGMHVSPTAIRYSNFD